jgi:hypothetical protein
MPSSASEYPPDPAQVSRSTPGTEQGWRALAAQAMARQREGRADDAAAALARMVREPGLPLPIRQACLRQMADLCLNSFGDAAGASVIHAQLAREAAGGVAGRTGADAADRAAGNARREAELAQIVGALYLGNAGCAEIAARLRGLAAPLQAQADALARTLASARPGPRPAGSTRPRRAARARRLRVALISNQWCASPVAFLALGALRELAREAELIFVDRGGKADWAQAAFRELAPRESQWLACRGLPAEALAARLHDAELDALIDLSGWTDPDALLAVASRPAPRLLKWVGGQSATTGLDCFDAFVTDARQAPPGCEPLYRETLLRVPEGYVTYTSAPYADLAAAAANPPSPRKPSRPDVFALVSNPVKISARTAEFVRGLRPRRLLLIDHRWRHRQTRAAAAQRLGSLMDVAEFVTPADHPTYLETLRALDASVIDTAPYSMGLTAVELRLLGKTVIEPPRTLPASMSELHGAAHLRAPGFAHHRLLAQHLLAACRAQA